MDLFTNLKGKIKGKDKAIVFPEGEDGRVLGAALRLAQEGLLRPVILGNEDKIKDLAHELGKDVLANVTLIDPEKYLQADFDDMVNKFVERRKGKNTPEQAREWLKDVNYFGTMLDYMNKADGLVSGALHATSDTVRPALQIIKTKPGLSKTSGAFIMTRDDGAETYVFADCAINIDPTAEDLAEIAVTSAETARLFDIDPKVAMLSFSTKGSAKGEQVDKVVKATEIAHKMAPSLPIDGELQFDASFVPTVAKQKAPGSDVAGHATVFVFPELQAGNIGYKIAQRFGGFEAIGPVLQGLNEPVSDLSRGCNEQDVYNVAIMTAAQAVMG
ncbi:phosphate acetyltransferase [Ligilactobacillus pobuzihii]|uniref:phosphate acetyltransferase n=1 Tax=Ligilactobacillus pobuzihii TaxID=449659 RepID=UPI0019D19609|nr:phosphate acetyltransferase [Ligilactobacillus pobuzihii]MBN7274337.1 phosphate acetyltransferase [Ligilactobacillus pobuzihii]